MVKLLLENNIEVEDALMHAIQLGSDNAVEIICKHFAKEPDELVT